MDLGDWKVIVRWIHVLAGITWIGHLYFFNWVNSVFAKTLDGSTKPKVVPELMPRALWWFRWGAMITFLSGVVLIILLYFVGEGAPGFAGNDASLMGSVRGQWIMIGATFGTIMWFNVWFIIWPRQRKIVPWIKAGEAPPEMAGMVKTATLASKINTYFSGPMLFGMIIGAHAGDYGVEGPLRGGLVWFAISIIGGFAIIHFMYMMAPKVGTLEE